jgi:hypothetical protein
MIKLPRTRHIEGSGLASHLDPDVMKFNKLAGEFLVVEEKLDGTGVSIFFDDQLNLQLWHRGSPATGKEFQRLQSWAELHQDELFNVLENRYVLFGEWMLHKHAIFYDRLPSFFLESDMYDRQNEIWLSTMARSQIWKQPSLLRSVPVIAAFKPTSLNQITTLLHRSAYQSEHWREVLWQKSEKEKFALDKILAECDQSDLAEGLYIKHEDDEQVLGRYKYVRKDFIENIIKSGTHLIDRIPFHNISVQGV